MSNSVVHWQMLSAEPDRVAAFYGSLFGWEVSTANGMGYRTVASGGDAGIDGGIWPAPTGSPETVQLYVEVPDIDTALAEVAELGGSTLLAKQMLPDGDAMAIAVDPMGRSFGVMTTRPRG